MHHSWIFKALVSATRLAPGTGNYHLVCVARYVVRGSLTNFLINLSTFTKILVFRRFPQNLDRAINHQFVDYLKYYFNNNLQTYAFLNLHRTFGQLNLQFQTFSICFVQSTDFRWSKCPLESQTSSSLLFKMSEIPILRITDTSH